MSKVRRWVGRYLLFVSLVYTATCSAFEPSLSTDAQLMPRASAIEQTIDSDPLGDFIKTLPGVYLPVDSDPDSNLVHALAERFKKPETLIRRVVDAANRFAHDDYPKRENILAIIAVESSFNPQASFQGSLGLMQVLVSVHRKRLKGKSAYNVEDNVSVGVSILRGYYETLGRMERSAVLAYNAGIGNFLKRRYNIQYHRKYVKELAFIRSITP